jgi:hypothetical protein
MVARAERFVPSGLADEAKAGASFREGDVLGPKIDNIPLLAEANDGARQIVALKKADDLVFLGAERDGFLQVQSSNGRGWVSATLGAKR